MIPENVRAELRSPIVGGALLLIVASGIYGVFLARLAVVWPVISLVVTVYLIYLFIRLVLAVEEIASEA